MVETWQSVSTLSGCSTKMGFSKPCWANKKKEVNDGWGRIFPLDQLFSWILVHELWTQAGWGIILIYLNSFGSCWVGKVRHLIFAVFHGQGNETSKAWNLKMNTFYRRVFLDIIFFRFHIKRMGCMVRSFSLGSRSFSYADFPRSSRNLDEKTSWIWDKPHVPETLLKVCWFWHDQHDPKP